MLYNNAAFHAEIWLIHPELCRKKQNFPMSFLSYKPTRETKSMKNNFQRKLLREKLFKAKKALAEHVSKVYEKRNILKSVLPSRLLPSVLVFTSLTLFNTRKSVEATHTKKLENLSKELPLFNLHNTVKLFELDIVPSKYVWDTLALF